jgi:hypothetical protein
MANITHRKVNMHAYYNDTFLKPYAGCIVRLTRYKNGRVDIGTQDGIIPHCEGDFISIYNGWKYTVAKLLGKPLSHFNHPHR